MTNLANQFVVTLNNKKSKKYLELFLNEIVLLESCILKSIPLQSFNAYFNLNDFRYNRQICSNKLIQCYMPRISC